MSSLFPRLAAPDDAVALACGDASLTYTELAAATRAHALRLAHEHVRPGDHVGVVTTPSLETMVALVGNVCAGVVNVPLSPTLGTREREHITADAAPKLVVEGRLELGDRGAAPVRAVDDAPLLVLYTSGTTGAPKGAVLTARNVASNLDGLARAWALTDRDTITHALPLFHVHGLVLGLFGALRAGATLRLLPRFDPAEVAAHLCAPAGGGTSVLYAVPTMVHRLAAAAERDASVVAGLRAARLLVSGSAALPVREHARIRALTGTRFVERYGLTETLIDCAMRHDDTDAPGRVGRPVDGVALRLVDDARVELDATDDTTIGEVAVRGPNVFAGYLHRPDATAAVVDDDGWFYTGDLATRDASGSVRIVGRRATDLIKTGGFKVGAGEVEAALLEHADVAECAVLGVADADLGERIVAYVVPRDVAHPPSPAALTAHVASLIAAHKRPRDVKFLAALPRNAMGKVQKQSLRAADEGERGRD